jgi:hypothetical protein
MNEKAEEIRIRYLYRDIVLRKKVRLSFEAARSLVGPDCAYHLYSVLDAGKYPMNSSKSQKKDISKRTTGRLT